MKINNQNGKGDSPRNCLSDKFRDNYDAIFNYNSYSYTRSYEIWEKKAFILQEKLRSVLNSLIREHHD